MRAYILVEGIIEEPFEGLSMTKAITFFYAVVLACAKDVKPLTYEVFLDYLDENPARLEEFTCWYSAELERIRLLTPREEDDKKKER